MAIYGAILAAGTLALQWSQLARFARTSPGDVTLGLVALGFLVLGVVVGVRLVGPAPAPPEGNPAARASLGISEREFEVLKELAAGHSNKEIARRLGVSPNTVKTHIARLYEKLGASRRTDAVRRARELDLLA